MGACALQSLKISCTGNCRGRCAYPVYFSVRLPATESGDTFATKVGYVVSDSADKGGSRFYLLDVPQSEWWTQEPFAVCGVR